MVPEGGANAVQPVRAGQKSSDQSHGYLGWLDMTMEWTRRGAAMSQPVTGGKPSHVTPAAKRNQSLPLFARSDGDDLNRDDVLSLNVPKG